MGIKTVGGQIRRAKGSKSKDPLLQKQKESIAQMRAALLAVSSEGGTPAQSAIQTITVMQIYHQLSRIIRYTEMMDKLENKLYESIEYTADHADVADTDTLILLTGLQEKLQKSMVESHKLLEPYLDMQQASIPGLAETESTTPNLIMSPEGRDRVRANAQSMLCQLQRLEDDERCG